jgi:hypothetical protein
MHEPTVEVSSLHSALRVDANHERRTAVGSTDSVAMCLR